MAELRRSAPAVESQKLPQIRIGKSWMSRLICGTNPFGGTSHLSWMINREFRQYYTRDQVLKTFRRCQEVGINTWQAGSISAGRFFDRDSGIQCIVNAYGDVARIQELAKMGCIGIGHHGSETDKLFKAGQLDKVREYCKRVRDSGLLVGVVTHIPAVVDTVESEGWDVDYYMTCVYQLGRSAAELEKLLTPERLPVEARVSGEVYLESDPPRMYRVIRQTKKPCLAFKILAAGRLCERPQRIEQAFKETFENIKSSDAVVVGMYDRYTDQPAENAEYVRRFGSNSPW
jgi:hypothetical protein